MGRDANNIVLTGMPGSGKSTVGVILAKMTSRNFVDTDILIQISHGRTLQDIVDNDGYEALRRIEESVLLQLKCTGHVIATGGSAVYSLPAMMHLKSSGTIVFLDVDLCTLERRVTDFHTRGLLKREDQTLADLFEERGNLYRQCADLTVPCGNLHQDEIAAYIIGLLEKR